MIEATGEYRRAAVAALALKGSSGEPGEPQAGTGLRRGGWADAAKTDALDAQVLAEFAERVRPTGAAPLAGAQTQEITGGWWPDAAS